MPDAEREIRRILATYCETIDDADFDGFARLFERGRWFLADAPGAAPVRSWLDANIVLHDGRTRTQHEVSNLEVDVAGDTADFRCDVTISQALTADPPELLARTRFTGTFRRTGDRWWWTTHTSTPTYVGNLAHHIRAAP